MSRAPGWLKIHRQMADAHDRLWSERREFSQWEARFDLLMQARFAPGVYATVHGEDFLARGEMVASLNYLAQRWSWHRARVERFLQRCVECEFLARQRSGQHGTVYLVVNYERYQGEESASETPSETGAASETASETPSETPSETGVERVTDGVLAAYSRDPKASETPSETGSGTANETKDKKENKKTTVREGRQTWLTPYLEAWKAQHGTDLLAGRASTFLSKVEKDLGADECLARWRRYLVKTPLIYASAADFSQKHSAFTGDTPAGSGDKADWFKKNGYGA